MTVSESVIAWLKDFEPEGFGKLQSIDTDMQSTAVSTYALTKGPEHSSRTYLSGRKEYTIQYRFSARLSNANETQRVQNSAWGEALEAYIEENNKIGNLPVLKDGKLISIKTLTPFQVEKAEADSSLYQMTMEIKYVKES